MKISILCPTRGRPEFLYDFIYSALGTAANPNKLEFVFYTDNDDEKSNVFFKNNLCFLEKDFEGKFNSDIQIKRINGNRIVLSQMWNACYEISTGEILMHSGDDLRFRTKNWDQIVIDKFCEYEDKIVFVYGYDGYQTKDFGTHGFIHKNWVETVGYFVPPYFVSDFNDTWLNDVAKSINRHVYVDIYTEHLHPIVGKHTWDKTHQERKVRHKQQNPKQIYNNKLFERQSDALKLNNFIKNFKK